MARLTLAIFLLLSVFSVFPQAFGGEWHSAGNAPLMPHRPSGTANLKCSLTGYTQVGKKTYRFTSERNVRDEEFRGPEGTWAHASHTLETTGDPGMDGQSFSLNYGLRNGQEVLELQVTAKVEGKAQATSRFTAPREGKEIRGISNLTIANSGRKGVSWVRVVAECRELN